MGSYISIGFLFEENQNIVTYFTKFLKHIVKNGVIQRCSYSADEEGNN